MAHDQMFGSPLGLRKFAREQKTTNRVFPPSPSLGILNDGSLSGLYPVDEALAITRQIRRPDPAAPAPIASRPGSMSSAPVEAREASGPSHEDVARALWVIYNASENPADFVRADEAMRPGRGEGGSINRDMTLSRDGYTLPPPVERDPREMQDYAERGVPLPSRYPKSSFDPIPEGTTWLTDPVSSYDRPHGIYPPQQQEAVLKALRARTPEAYRARTMDDARAWLSPGKPLTEIEKLNSIMRGGAKEGSGQQRVSDFATGVLDLTPVGAVSNTLDAVKHGDYVDAALNALGMIPGGYGIARGQLKGLMDRSHRKGQADGGEIHEDNNMSHDDIVSRAVHVARRHFATDGYADPIDDQPSAPPSGSPGFVDSALSFLSQFNPVGSAEAAPRKSIVDTAKRLMAPEVPTVSGPVRRTVETPASTINPTPEAVGATFPQLPASVLDLNAARGAAAPSDVVSGLTGAFAPNVPPIRGQTGLEIKAMQERALTPAQMDTLTSLRAKNPEFDQASRFLLPEELQGVIANPRQIEQMTRLLEVIPQSEQMASLAKAGAAKQGWYRGSTQALIDVFGLQDAPRFSALLAATSPKTSVESNLLNTLNIWKNWDAAGRPTDPASIKRVLGASVQGGKGEESVLDAWVNNSVRALSTTDPRAITLSGPKVNSFFRNLADDVYRVTNDAWISNATNISQDLLRVSPTPQQLAAGNPGYSPGYLALSARQREGGQMVRMVPNEAQETIWSVAMPLMEGATKAGLHPREFLQRNLLTPDLIRGTPDFSSLLREDPRYASVIQQMGRGEQLKKMQPFAFQRQLPQMTASDNANLERTADTLGSLGERRRRESRAMFPGYDPNQSSTFANVTTSGIPGRGTGVAERIIDAPAGSRSNFSSRVANVFQDPTGMDILHKNLNLNPISTKPSTELWRPDLPANLPDMQRKATEFGGYRPPFETGRGYTASVETPIVTDKNGRKIVDPAVERALEIASTVRGAMTAQHATPHHALIGDPKGNATSLTFPKKYDSTDQQGRFGLMGALNTEPLAIADTGRTLSVFPTGKTPRFTLADRDWMKDSTGATDAVPVTNIAGKKSYVDLSSKFSQPEGSRAVAKTLLSATNKLTPEEMVRFDNVEFRRAAGDLHDLYSTQNAKDNRVRPDFLNMLAILRDKGIQGLQAAYSKKEFLPVLAALGIGAQGAANDTSASGAR